MDFLELEGKDEEDIVFDVFDLNGLQESLFEEMENAELTVKELAERVDRNRSTVQRALQDMLDKDLVLRKVKQIKQFIMYIRLFLKKNFLVLLEMS